MLQVSNYSLVLSVQFIIMIFDLFANSFSELLLTEPVVPLIIFVIQDIGILFNIIIIFLMFFNTFVFQAGLVKLLIHRFTGTIIVSGIYFILSVSFHVWIENLRWQDQHKFVWTNWLQAFFVFQRFAAVLYYYCYKRTTLCLGDPRLYEDSEWLQNEFFRVRK
ncbi:transmembrane protein 138 [Hypanus sabinus]|uniref:transmembrane protein 138 n=1 Tax=Hypanus sabinus TaxID=79690 RepID=UPI0028C391AB|nr:transmembrane protein 138 [Hypanus sabinus]